MLLAWPSELINQYARCILSAICHILSLLQHPTVSAETTISQLCQAMGCATALADLAADVQQAASTQVAFEA